MRTIVHLSDLHFGRIDRATTAPLTAAVQALNPDVVVVSGDLTQRARSWEFQEARRFLDALPAPQIVVPGNHDVSATNPFRRFLSPLAQYRTYMGADLLPSHIDTELAIIGLNSTRSLTTKHGRLRNQDIDTVSARLKPLPAGVIRMIVCHHPFDLPADHARRDLIGGASHAMKAFAACGVDVILCGHLHRSSATATAARYRIPHYSALVVQAGTAISSRGRGESNSFNVVRVESGSLTVERLSWNEDVGVYETAGMDRFQRMPEGWRVISV